MNGQPPCPRNPPRFIGIPDVTVLVIVGSQKRPVNLALRQLRADMSLCRIIVNIFDSLRALPQYSDDRETLRTPKQVVALRNAADAADAVLIVANYYDCLPKIVHNAIDWLTCGRQSGLSDKPLAVVGREAECYSGVWTHCQTGEAGRTSGAPIIDSITAATLHEAVQMLADEVDLRAIDSPTFPTMVSSLDSIRRLAEPEGRISVPDHRVCDRCGQARLDPQFHRTDLGYECVDCASPVPPAKRMPARPHAADPQTLSRSPDVTRPAGPAAS
jgi:NAD(P)H-dependent FMN reductase